MKKLKWSRKKIVGLIAAVLVAVVIVVSAVNAGGTEGRYQETTVAARDIVSYLEFSGNIEAVDVYNVYAGVAAQIREVKVEEGDQVEAGDVIAVLDSSEVEYNIAVQEATLNEAELTDSYNIKDSQTSLDNLNEQLDSGLNSTLNTAQETLLTAQQNYQDAVETYNQAKEELDNGTTQAVVSARQSVASAQASYDSAEDQHENHMITDEALATYAVTLSNAQESLRLAQETAEQDVQDYYDAMVEAEEALANAESDYAAAELSMEQNVETTEDTLERTQALASQETTKLQIEHLKDSLNKDYEGTISRISKTATVENEVSYLDAVVEFEADDDIMDGLSAEVRLIQTQELGVPALPSEAISYKEDNTAYVYIRDENGNLTEQTVSLGETDGTWVQITEGLEAGDTVFYQYTPSYLMNTTAPAATMTAAQ